MYVWEPFVETYLQMGWVFAPRAVLYEDRGGYPSFLMMWLCDCKMPYLKVRKH